MTLLVNRIKKVFDRLDQENDKAFISFAVAGFPNEDASFEIAKSIIDAGADIHEIAFPHAEAQADGPIIQLANLESIRNGITMEKTINIAKRLREYNSDVGLVMMGYLNNIFIYGIEKFAKEISGIIDGIICVDLPNDVVEHDQLHEALKKENISLIRLITPTTSEKRIGEIVENAEGFIYSFNVQGIPGVKEAKIDQVNDQIKRIKKCTSLPTVAGFGIKTAEDVKVFADSEADGIVIGSSIVEKVQEKMNETSDQQNIAKFIFQFCSELINNIKK